MVVHFVSEELKEEIKRLIEFFDEHDIDHDFCTEYLSDEYEEEDEREFIIDENLELDIWFPGDYEADLYTIGEILEMVHEAENVQEIDEYKFVGKRLALFRIDSIKGELLNRTVPTITERVNEQNYTINIVEGLTSFGIRLTIDKQYSEYVPPVDYDDVFIEIFSDDKMDVKILQSLVEAYLFELKATLGLEFHLSPKILYDPWDKVYDLRAKPTKLRPLLQGKGILELLKLYNSSLSTSNAEILILTYTKVIEYVSPTVIQKDLISSASKKLSSSRALAPDASYILELSKIFERNRNNKKDKLAIKMTVETCCDLFEINSIAPPFLNNTRNLTLDSKPEEKQKAYDEIANAISNTRNMLAHAKTNYEKKGKECPKEQLNDFSKCLDILAQQIIRWFSREHEINRIV